MPACRASGGLLQSFAATIVTRKCRDSRNEQGDPRLRGDDMMVRGDDMMVRGDDMMVRGDDGEWSEARFYEGRGVAEPRGGPVK